MRSPVRSKLALTPDLNQVPPTPLPRPNRIPSAPELSPTNSRRALRSEPWNRCHASLRSTIGHPCALIRRKPRSTQFVCSLIHASDRPWIEEQGYSLAVPYVARGYPPPSCGPTCPRPWSSSPTTQRRARGPRTDAPICLLLEEARDPPDARRCRDGPRWCCVRTCVSARR
jgi:hypothetical protein